MKRALLLLGFMVIIIVVTVGIFKESTEKPKDEIILGSVLSFTGSAAADSESIKRGIDMAVNDLSKQGIDVRMVYENDDTDPAQTVSAISKLVATDKPKVILGPAWSFLSSASAGVLAQNNLISLQPACTSEFVDRGDADMFFGAIKNVRKEVPIANLIKKIGSKKVAIIVDDGGWGQSHIEPFRNAAVQGGAQVVLEERIPFGQEINSVPTVLLKVKEMGADMILWTGFDSGASILIKKASELKLDSVIVGEQLLALGDRRERILTSGLEVYTMEAQMYDEFVQKHKSVYGYEPHNYADSAYDLTMIAVEALQSTNGSRDAIVKYLQNDLEYEGFATTYNFDENGDIVGGEWIMKKVE